MENLRKLAFNPARVFQYLKNFIFQAQLISDQLAELTSDLEKHKTILSDKLPSYRICAYRAHQKGRDQHLVTPFEVLLTMDINYHGIAALAIPLFLKIVPL